jgi:hypothetical protein
VPAVIGQRAVFPKVGRGFRVRDHGTHFTKGLGPAID